MPVIVNLDVETYSEAGYTLDGGKWVSVSGPGKVGGLPACGMDVYARHPSTEILVEADEDRTHPPLSELPDHPEVTHMRRVDLCGPLIRHICILR